jgi:O-antigen/teichoic acid export membrane protein
VNEEKSEFFSREAMGAVPWILASKVLLFFAYFGISILIVRSLGKQDYGVFALCKNFAGLMVILCGLGMNAAILRFVPELAVNRNRAGLMRLLWKTAVIQTALTLVVTAILTPMTPLFDRWFDAQFGPLILLTGISVVFILAKSWYNDVMTSLFMGKWVAIISFVQGISWAILMGWLAWQGGATVFSVIVVEIISIILSGLLATFVLWKYLAGLRWKSPVEGIGRKRVLSMGLATWGGSIGRALMARYTETFFIGFYFGPAAVAVYDLGYSATLLVITFIPMALQTIFASGLAEAYVKDPGCLPRLVHSLYKVLILLSLPVAAFGVFFAPSAVILFYGEEMKGAGWIASAFCVIHLLPLIAIPLSMAIGAKEKVKEFLPLLYIRVVVNVLLDWILISRFGIPGAIAAIVLTFVLTFPLRLRYIRNFLGGFHFPAGFFLRFSLVCPLLAGGLWLVTPAGSHLWLFVAAAVYFLLLGLLLRFTPLIRHTDVAELRSLNFSKLNRLLDLLVGKNT